MEKREKTISSFECKSCATLIGIAENKEPNFCPLCRGKMVKIEPEINFRKKVICPDCKNEFLVEENFSPYKCAFCNFTFPTSPHRRFEERL
ncbi:MAG: hypothetical protein ABDH49_00640 [Candidatus Hydrothermales bacterium]